MCEADESLLPAWSLSLSAGQTVLPDVWVAGGREVSCPAVCVVWCGVGVGRPDTRHTAVFPHDVSEPSCISRSKGLPVKSVCLI
ncbi:hypothetical protein E2C01_090081 [Portunus trituberculatus]|uniref:Uncharacterized protein n=1 Tax=Portunus trituberculatus TaxID=210409 RepID=A0A5B7JAI3_PORTR|nr:hypothetical protein [Portunus trituberculatus]